MKNSTFFPNGLKGKHLNLLCIIAGIVIFSSKSGFSQTQSFGSDTVLTTGVVKAGDLSVTGNKF
jgi:hypothetical protein